jgi:hypothetical protein
MLGDGVMVGDGGCFRAPHPCHATRLSVQLSRYHFSSAACPAAYLTARSRFGSTACPAACLTARLTVRFDGVPGVCLTTRSTVQFDGGLLGDSVDSSLDDSVRQLPGYSPDSSLDGSDRRRLARRLDSAASFTRLVRCRRGWWRQICVPARSEIGGAWGIP